MFAVSKRRTAKGRAHPFDKLRTSRAKSEKTKIFNHETTKVGTRHKDGGQEHEIEIGPPSTIVPDLLAREASLRGIGFAPVE